MLRFEYNPDAAARGCMEAFETFLVDKVRPSCSGTNARTNGHIDLNLGVQRSLERTLEEADYATLSENTAGVFDTIATAIKTTYDAHPEKAFFSKLSEEEQDVVILSTLNSMGLRADEKPSVPDPFLDAPLTTIAVPNLKTMISPPSEHKEQHKRNVGQRRDVNALLRLLLTSNAGAHFKKERPFFPNTNSVDIRFKRAPLPPHARHQATILKDIFKPFSKRSKKPDVQAAQRLFVDSAHGIGALEDALGGHMLYTMGLIRPPGEYELSIVQGTYAQKNPLTNQWGDSKYDRVTLKLNAIADNGDATPVLGCCINLEGPKHGTAKTRTTYFPNYANFDRFPAMWNCRWTKPDSNESVDFGHMAEVLLDVLLTSTFNVSKDFTRLSYYKQPRDYARQTGGARYYYFRQLFVDSSDESDDEGEDAFVERMSADRKRGADASTKMKQLKADRTKLMSH